MELPRLGNLSTLTCVGSPPNTTQEPASAPSGTRGSRSKTLGMRNKATELLLELADRIQTRLSELFDRLGQPEAGSGLDQDGLRDGRRIIEDFVRHGEEGLAAEHLLYMICRAGAQVC
jgi:hypothetical protein